MNSQRLEAAIVRSVNYSFQLLIVSDSRVKIDQLASRLEKIGYSFIERQSAMEVKWLETLRPNVIVICCPAIYIGLMEKITLFDWARQIPVICLISIHNKSQLFMLVNAGITDFMFRPFEPEDLEARVLLHLKKSLNQGIQGVCYPIVERRNSERRKSAQPVAELVNFVSVGPDSALSIHLAKKEVFLNGQLLSLTPKEFALLALLASDPGRVFPDQEILIRLWSDSKYASSADIAQYVHRLRKKLGDDPCCPKWILNVKRFGYRLNPNPEIQSSCAALPVEPQSAPECCDTRIFAAH
ncbi:MAG: two-component system, OmpR family, alkaline phosphatase synthesis response regulator PhoP [Pseudomonadota bacterium]|nr:two-component system, OmpR family, alkaline phosphatase synthesis response regulator PhoP [Pseudomonadota bacterium]